MNNCRTKYLFDIFGIVGPKCPLTSLEHPSEAYVAEHPSGDVWPKEAIQKLHKVGEHIVD